MGTKTSWWFKAVGSGAYRELAQKAVQDFHDGQWNYADFLPNGKYDPFGDFLNYGIHNAAIFANPRCKAFDKNGIVMIKSWAGGGDFYYNPVTIAQYGLTLYGQYLYGTQLPSAFIKQTDFLINMQAPNGSFPCNGDFPYYLAPEKYFRPGWVSAMANGNILSLLARVYHLTGQEKYLKAARKALQFLRVPVAEHGAMATLGALEPAYEKFVIYEEYPTDPPAYTLNGFMYALIGIYDWTCIDSEFSGEAESLFLDGIKTLEKILPFYDIGGFTSYDLAHLTYYTETLSHPPHIGINYHREHVVFCKIFYDLTGIDAFKHYYELWASYVDRNTSATGIAFDWNKICDFCGKYEKLYVYGAGQWGQQIIKEAAANERCKISFAGVIVSDGCRKVCYIGELPVYELSSVHLDAATGLIIAIEDLASTALIKHNLHSLGFQNILFLNQC